MPGRPRRVRDHFFPCRRHTRTVTLPGPLDVANSTAVRWQAAHRRVGGAACNWCSGIRTAQQLRHEGIDAAVRSSTATARDTARTILELARRTSADVLVVGNSAHGPVASLVLGGVAGRLLQRAPCPVILVPCHSTDATSTADANVAAGSVRA